MNEEKKEESKVKLRWGDETDTAPAPKRPAPDTSRKVGDKLVFFGRIGLVVLGLIILFFAVILPNIRYSHAKSLQEQGRYEEAYEAFEALGNMKDSGIRAEECSKLAAGAETAP